MIGALIRPAARLALSGIFIVAGAQAAREPGGRTGPAARLGVPDPELAVRGNGAAMVLGGAALALGYRTRLAALALLASLAITTYAAHAFWREETPEGRSRQQIQFLKNLGLAGGLLLLLAPSGGQGRQAERDRPKEPTAGDPERSR